MSRPCGYYYMKLQIDAYYLLKYRLLEVGALGSQVGPHVSALLNLGTHTINFMHLTEHHK